MRPYRSGDTVIMDRDVYTHQLIEIKKIKENSKKYQQTHQLHEKINYKVL